MTGRKLLIGVFILFFLFVAVDGDLRETRVKVDNDNLFAQLFREPVEICYLIMNDGTIYMTTQYLEDRVYFDVDQAKKSMEKRGHTIEDIVIIVHNHLKPYRISDDDKKLYYHLKDEGFTGAFVIFLQDANLVLIYEEK